MTINLGSVPMTPVGPSFKGGLASIGTGGGNPTSTILFAQPDDSVVLFAQYSSATGCQIDVWRVNPDGSFTYYTLQTGVAFDYFGLITPVGPGLFFAVTGRTGIPYSIQTVNMRSNNTVPFLINQASPAIGDPCNPVGSPPTRMYYDKSRSILAAGYYTVVGAGATIVSQMIGVDPQTGRLGNTIRGFCCNTNFGGDVFDLTTSSQPPGSLLDGAGFLSNGKAVILTFTNGADWEVTAQDITINLGQNAACDGSGGTTGSFVQSINGVTYDTGIPYVGQNGKILDSIISGVTGCYIDGGVLIAFNGPQSYIASMTGIDNGQVIAAALTPRELWMFSLDGGGANVPRLSIAANPGILSPYSGIADIHGYPSTSFARPISIYGAFKA